MKTTQTKKVRSYRRRRKYQNGGLLPFHAIDSFLGGLKHASNFTQAGLRQVNARRRQRGGNMTNFPIKFMLNEGRDFGNFIEGGLSAYPNNKLAKLIRGRGFLDGIAGRSINKAMARVENKTGPVLIDHAMDRFEKMAPNLMKIAIDQAIDVPMNRIKEFGNNKINKIKTLGRKHYENITNLLVGQK